MEKINGTKASPPQVYGLSFVRDPPAMKSFTIVSTDTYTSPRPHPSPGTRLPSRPSPSSQTSSVGLRTSLSDTSVPVTATSAFLSSSRQSSPRQSSIQTLQNEINSLKAENAQNIPRMVPGQDDAHRSDRYALTTDSKSLYSHEARLHGSQTSPPLQHRVTFNGDTKKGDYSPERPRLSAPSLRDTDDWTLKQKALEAQLSGIRDECRKLHEACSEAEQRANRRSDSLLVERPFSSQSMRGTTSYVPTVSTRNPRAPKSTSDPFKPFSTNLSLPSGSHDMLSLDRSLSGSTTSLSSVKDSVTRSGYGSSGYGSGTYSSFTHGGSGSSVVELERLKSKNRRLEKEVSVLEQQLKDKTKSGEKHVEELTQLRSLLAQEKASNAITSHQIQEKAASEIGRVKALHMEQVNDLESQIKKLKAEKSKTEEELGQLKTVHKAGQNEAKFLSDNVTQLLAQLDEERGVHRESMSRLQNEAEAGQRKVGQLQRELESCQQELARCLDHVEHGRKDGEKENAELKQQVNVLSQQLEECRKQLQEAGRTINHLKYQLDEMHQLLQEKDGEETKKERMLKEKLKESETGRQNLLENLDRANAKLTEYSAQITTLQESALLVRRLEGEVLQLRQLLSEQQGQKSQYQSAREAAETESERLKEEYGELKKRLEQSSKQLAEMQQRSEDWRVERERSSSRIKELQVALDQKQREINSLRDQLKDSRLNNQHKETELELSVEQMQQELSKRAQQVMELDQLLRAHQAETASKRLQLERTLAHRQSDLRARTQEVEDLSQQLGEAKKTIEYLQEKLVSERSVDTFSEQHRQRDIVLQSRINQLEKQCELKQKSLVELTELVQIGKDRMQQLTTDNQRLEREISAVKRESEQRQRSHEATNGELASRDAKISELQQRVQELLQQDKTRQEEVGRCRTQVASLSSELASEREMLEQTREELAATKAAKQMYPLPRPASQESSTTLGSSAASEMEFARLPKPINAGVTLLPTTTRNIIHI